MLSEPSGCLQPAIGISKRVDFDCVVGGIIAALAKLLLESPTYKY